MSGDLITGGLSVIGEALTTSGNTLSIELSSPADFTLVLEVITKQLQSFVENPVIAVVIGFLVAGILLNVPEQHKSKGWIISIVVSTLLVGLVSKAGEVNASIWTIALLGILLGVVTSIGYDVIKQKFAK